ncbi:MAG: hypothetical protein M4D80_27695 [Myxococcota bacterium]|nr:hypothetical protein [Myxococcota bacterium]
MRISLLLMAISLSVGCGVGEITDSVAQPNLVVLDEAVAAGLTVEANRLTVATGAAGALASARVGDVIVSNGPAPFLRKVVAVESQAGQLALVTEPAALTDAILRGHVSSERDVFAEPLPTGYDGLIIPINNLALDFTNNKIIDEVGIQVTLNRGTVRFRPYVDVDLKIEDGSLSHFHAIVRGDLEASVGISIDSTRSFNRGFSKTLWQSPPYTATQFIGTVPVVEVVRVSLILTGEAHATAGGRVDLGSATAKASVEAGASYTDGRWRPVANPSISFNARGPSFTVGASAGASVRLSTRVDVKFYDVAGPYVVVGAYARTDLSASVSNGLDWVSRAGVDAMFGGHVAVLGKTLAEYNRSLFDVGKDFAQ